MRPRQDANPAMLAAEPTLHDAVLIGFAAREQGLVVAVGNPLQLKSLGEAQARHLRAALRPAGPAPSSFCWPCCARTASASRACVAVLVAPTGPDIAQAIRAGNADFGIATRAVATAARLDFIPICIKRFDLLMRQRDYFPPPIQALLALFREPRFAARAAELGGLDVGAAGRVRWAP
jgi:molybdate-binding protein